MKRLLTFIVVVVLLGWLLFKAAVWWLADQRLAEAREAVESVGVIDRGTIRSGIEGRLLLADARYQDFRLAQPVEIGRLAFDAGSPLNLLTALMDPGRLPVAWSLRAEKVELRLEASMFRNWVTASGEASQALFAPVCGPDHRQQLGSGDLVRMGVDGVTGEALIRQYPDRLYLELTTESTGSLEVEWPGARVDIMNPERLVRSGEGPMAVTIRDGGLMRRIAAYCARESSVAMDEWTRIVMDAFRQGLNLRGYEASAQLLALYRQWLIEGGELTLMLNPDQPVYGVPVQGTEQERAPDLMVSYNGQKVPDVYLEEVEPPEPTVSEKSLQPVVPEGTDNQVAGWYPAELAEAGRWVGHNVRITLSNDNVVEGRLASVGEQTLEVARTVGGGEIAYPMTIRAIETFEVWQRGQIR
ncbi:acetylornithine deacetylase [uncultured Marinobacter sp.]|uniref:acetylornithine deacetylase n=1 Tax=uncultured Marinobacter sp. TaxID=187379 RepID=UPI0026173A64|nr:acetylornithine deacetylase [uncultured Marinobacter sp.]